VIQYDKSMKIVVFSQFIELAQDPSDAALAEKCSRVLLGNWQDFLLAIIKKANHLIDLCDQDSVFAVAAPSLASFSSGLGTLSSDRRNSGVLDSILAAPIEEHNRISSRGSAPPRKPRSSLRSRARRTGLWPAPSGGRSGLHSSCPTGAQ
jgi:hypothetical protein